MTGRLPACAFDGGEILEGLEDWIRIESPTDHRDGVNRMMDLAAVAMESIGATTSRHAGTHGFGDSVAARMPWGGDAPGILVLCHLDTVHPVGTLENALTYRREGDRVFGPGIYDMKGGAYIAWYALRQVVQGAGATPLAVTFLFTPDEEMGSPSTRGLIEEMARRSRYVLVPEPAQESGQLITGRWAFQRFVLRARGSPAHAGAALADGRSAIREMAEQIRRIEDMSEPARHATLSVGTVRGGTFVNVVPLECDAEVLTVTASDEDSTNVRRRLMMLESIGDGVTFEVEVGPVRPLFEPTKEGLALYQQALAIARGLGFEPGHGSVGGGSDGNFTGALGIPTLDGLGVCGDGFHTHQEHILFSSLAPRAALFAGLLATLR